MGRSINLNNAGCSLLNPLAESAVRQHLDLESEIGGYDAARLAAPRITEAYAALARAVGASDPIDVAYMDSATRAWNYFVYSLDIRPGQRILTAFNEFGTNLLSLRHAADRVGAKVELVHCEEDGTISIDDLRARLADDVALVAVSHVLMHRGIINPVEQIGRILSDYPQTRYLVDACQSIGQLPIDVGEFNCDALTATGRKWLRGPRGTGFLYVKRALADSLDPLTVDLSTARPLGSINEPISLVDGARRLETWERSIALVLGLGAAAQDYLDRGPETVYASVMGKTNWLRRQLVSIPRIKLLEAVDSPCGIVSFSIKDKDADQVKLDLAEHGFAVSTAHAFDAPLDFQHLGEQVIMRVSPHYYVSDSDLEKFAEALQQILA